MRIGCLQFAPQVGDVDNNLNRADAILNKANPENLDLLVLPELAFTGYNFKSLREISPYLEPTGAGITSLWARTTALKHDCKVVVGYPETADVTEKWPTSLEYYNSAIMVNEDGDTCGHYRKSHLYYTDESWAFEGPGFFSGTIDGLGEVAMGICMDINPYKFEAPWNAYEFAFHVLDVAANVVVLSMAWLTREDAVVFSCHPKEPDMETLTYWITRLEPLIRADTEEEIIVIFANRTGIEGNAVYAGTSAVLGIQNGEVTVYGILGRGEKELLVVDTNTEGYAKLVYRPGADMRQTIVPSRTDTNNQSRHDVTRERSNSTRTLPRSPSHSRGQPGVATPSSNTSRPSRDHIRTGSAGISASNARVPSSMDTEPPNSPRYTWNRPQRELSEDEATGKLSFAQQTSASLRSIQNANREVSRSGSRIEESNAVIASPIYRPRHQRSFTDPPSLTGLALVLTRDDNADSGFHQTSTNNGVPPSQNEVLSPNLERLGADLMVFEGARSSRPKRDSLICHVDEDDYIVLRRDSVPSREQQLLGEPVSRSSSRQFRDDSASWGVNKAISASPAQITEVKEIDSRRSVTPNKASRSDSRNRVTPQSQRPIRGSSRQRKDEHPSHRKESSTPSTRAYQAVEQVDGKHAGMEPRIHRHATLPMRTSNEHSSGSSRQPPVVRSVPPVEAPIFFSIDASETAPSSHSTPARSTSMPPTPKAMTAPSNCIDGEYTCNSTPLSPPKHQTSTLMAKNR